MWDVVVLEGGRLGRGCDVGCCGVGRRETGTRVRRVMLRCRKEGDWDAGATCDVAVSEGGRLGRGCDV